MATVCLVIGVVVGYLFRGSSGSNVVASTPPVASMDQPPGASEGGMGRKMPSLEDMKRMADKQAEPLVEKLKSSPNDAKLLIQLGDVYKATHQFKTAADYYARALKIEPRNAGVRSDMGSCLFYSGDADGALAQLEQALKDDPKHAGTLFNLGMIRWQAKMDAPGAISAWETLLKVHPELANKAGVEDLIAQARKHPTVKP